MHAQDISLNLHDFSLIQVVASLFGHAVY